MRRTLLDLVCCPHCRGTLHLDPGPSEILQGEIRCRTCARTFAVRDGMLDLHPEPTPEAQMEMHAHQVLADRWLSEAVPAHLRPLFNGESGIELTLDLPHCRHPALVESVASIRRLAEIADDYFALLDWLGLNGAEAAVEVGAHTGWSAHHLAARCRSVVATDISHQLALGQVYLDHAGFFERVFCDMAAFPFRNASLDLIFGVATLHHANDLPRVCARFAAALKPGGRTVFFAEPVAGRWDTNVQHTFGADEKDLGIQEHIFTIGQYFDAFRAAGLTPRIIPFASLCRAPERRWRLFRIAALRLIESGYAYADFFTRRLYPFMLQFYPKIPFPHFALVCSKEE